jgi:hypothetical protein
VCLGINDENGDVTLYRYDHKCSHMFHQYSTRVDILLRNCARGAFLEAISLFPERERQMLNLRCDDARELRHIFSNIATTVARALDECTGNASTSPGRAQSRA